MSFRFLTLLVFFNFFWFNIALATDGAKIDLSVSQVEFGEINQGDKVDHLFILKNIGDEPLIIGQVKTSCGCTVALPSKTNLLPNEMGELKVTFDSGRFTGKIRKEIYLSSNDKQNPSAKFTLTATVKPSVTALPETINFGTFSQNISKTATLNITNNGSEKLEIISIDVSDPTLFVSPVSAVVEKNKTVSFEVKMSPPNSGQKISCYILIHTNRNQQSLLRIPVFATGPSL